jgi:hypothetical protein
VSSTVFLAASRRVWSFGLVLSSYLYFGLLLLVVYGSAFLPLPVSYSFCLLCLATFNRVPRVIARGSVSEFAHASKRRSVWFDGLFIFFFAASPQ